jgi:hypothetical protein
MVGPLSHFEAFRNPGASMIRITSGMFILLIFALLLVAPRTTQAAQSYNNCTGFITSLPATITTQGTWCLKSDLTTAMTSGYAITINTNNVTIDCNDFKIGGLAAGVATQTLGIVAFSKQNTVVRRCNIRGFYYGTFIAANPPSVGGGVVEDSRFEANTYVGIHLDGNGSVVQRNQVLDTGGSTVQAQAHGIYSRFDVDIVDNTVSGVAAKVGGGDSARGIYTEFNVGGSISGNRVRGILKDGPGTAFAIYNGSSGRITIRGNDLVGNGTGSTGLSCSDSAAIARDNMISGFETGIAVCTDGGGNVIAP